MIINNDSMINSTLTESLRSAIKSKGLYNTGALDKSIEIELTVDERAQIEVKIKALHYIEYLDQDYRILNEWSRSIKFIDSIEEAVAAYIEWILNDPERHPDEIKIRIYIDPI